jgi:hypothetical protein
MYSASSRSTRAQLWKSQRYPAKLWRTETRKGKSTAPWQKVKFHRQIVAIAKVHGVSEIYSDDSDIAALSERAKIKVVRLADLPLPLAKAQLDLQLEPAPDFEPAAGFIEAISSDEP